MLRLRRLGAQMPSCVGNLKFAAAPLPADERELARLRASFGDRPVWFAASTHPGEEEMTAKVHRALAVRHPRLLTVIAPRHPERGEDVAARLKELGFRLARRRAGETPGAADEVYLADTLGELGLFYRLARVAFIGKSLVPEGGQNPLEAARLGCPILFGPHMTNFVEIAGRLADAGAAIEVANTADLAMTLDRLFGDAQARTRMAVAGENLANAESGALDAVLAALAPLLDGDARARA